MSDILEVAQAIQRHKELGVLQVLAPFANPVLVAGAYHGDTIRALKLIDPNCTVEAFEPQVHCHAGLEELLFHVDNVSLHKVALTDHDGTAKLYGPGSDFASLVDDSRNDYETVDTVNSVRYLTNLHSHWSLAILNMEGYEYILLPYLDRASVLHSFDNLLVQFHPKTQKDTAPLFNLTNFKIKWNKFPAWVWWQRDYDFR